MKRLFLPLLAAIALPTAVNAETIWLIIMKGNYNGFTDMEKIEMTSIEQCEEQGQKWDKDNSVTNYRCIIGK